MSAVPNIPSPIGSKHAVARLLATRQHDVEPEIERVFRIEAPGREADPNEPIKLLLVNPNTTASGIMPIWLTPDAPAGILYPSVVVEVHTSELAHILDGSLPLPHGWQFDRSSPLVGPPA